MRFKSKLELKVKLGKEMFFIKWLNENNEPKNDLFVNFI